ncbi:MAG TPA: Fic family protein, partial [Blastocatellia bacterium]|nr:Fic family protein [Blastocatellia bacterium]
MAARLPEDIDDELLRRIEASSDGLGIESLIGLLGADVSRRSLQRRLSKLVEAGKLATEGQGKATRYRVPAITPTTNQTEGSVILSPSGLRLRQEVRKPLTERIPVGYSREFVDGYRPNESTYLTPRTVAHLSRIGATPDAEQPAGTYARHILDRLLIDLSWASSRLEGNTYSLLDTQRLIELGQAAEGKNASETQMILNHKAAIEFLVECGEEPSFSRQNILNLHALLSDNLLPDPAASGRLRRRPVRIGGSVYHPLEGPQLIEDRFQQLVDTAAAIREPFE